VADDYHPYVFDTTRRAYVGRFEDMYRDEDGGGFDSWHERDLRMLRKTLSQTILDAYNFGRILEIGCGKGTFTQFLKKHNNHVIAVDGSETAIGRAKASFPDIDFRCMRSEDVGRLQQRFDLVVIMATLAYVESWPALLRTVADLTQYIYVAEYIPANPIGFVKSAGMLLSVLSEYFRIRTKVILDDEHCLVFAERLSPTHAGSGHDSR
jgi:SAM-dependent methyltransferase